MDELICGGIRKESNIEGYSGEIKSNSIVSFEYSNPKFNVSCKLEDNKLHIISNGGNTDKRDETRFKLNYISENLKFLKTLQDIVSKDNISHNNGYTLEVSGLPEGYGDRINIKYDSGENIYKYSNQSFTISEIAIKDIYEAFHTEALNNNLDFNTKKSNVKLYDDATEEYLQGTWKGTHFGENITVLFEKNHIKIYVGEKLTDDTDYIIFEGNVRPNKLKEEIDKVQSEHDYEEFNGVSSLRKKNDILLTAYFTKDSYSSCELLIQR